MRSRRGGLLRPDKMPCVWLPRPDEVPGVQGWLPRLDKVPGSRRLRRDVRPRNSVLDIEDKGVTLWMNAT